MSDISDAGNALAFLSVKHAEVDRLVNESMVRILKEQRKLSRLISGRDAIERTINITAQFVARETK